MKKIISSLFILLIVLNGLFFQEFRAFLLHLNFSWKFSFLFPFVSEFLCGTIVLVFSWGYFHKKWLRGLVSIILLTLPFGISFAFNPIYEGDLSKKGKVLEGISRIDEFHGCDFVVLTIPDCPYCKESTSRINILQQRNPEMRIKYVVCASKPDAVSELRSQLNSKVKIQTIENLQLVLEISQGKFPCFVRIEKGIAVYKWYNNQLGVRALDWLESTFQK